MGKFGWGVAVFIIFMVIGLAVVTESAEDLDSPNGCHYEYKMKNNKRVKVLDCD